MSDVAYLLFTVTCFSDLYNNVFSRRFIVFADSSINTAIFDFAKPHSALFLLNFSSSDTTNGGWKLVGWNNTHC